MDDHKVDSKLEKSQEPDGQGGETETQWQRFYERLNSVTIVESILQKTENEKFEDALKYIIFASMFFCF